MAPMFAEQGYVVEEAQIVSCDIEFTANGILYEVVNRDSLKSAFTKFLKTVLDDSLAQNNLTKEEFEASIGQTYDEYLTAAVQTSMDLFPKTIISAYKFEGDVLYIKDQDSTDFEKRTYSLVGKNKLILDDSGVSITYSRI